MLMEALREDRLSRNLKRSGAEMAEFAGTCAPCSAGSAAVACTSGRACAPCSAGSAAAACTSGRTCAPAPARPIPGRDVQEELGSEIWLGAG